MFLTKEFLASKSSAVRIDSNQSKKKARETALFLLGCGKPFKGFVAPLSSVCELKKVPDWSAQISSEGDVGHLFHASLDFSSSCLLKESPMEGSTLRTNFLSPPSLSS